MQNVVFSFKSWQRQLVLCDEVGYSNTAGTVSGFCNHVTIVNMLIV